MKYALVALIPLFLSGMSGAQTNEQILARIKAAEDNARRLDSLEADVRQMKSDHVQMMKEIRVIKAQLSQLTPGKEFKAVGNAVYACTSAGCVPVKEPFVVDEDTRPPGMKSVATSCPANVCADCPCPPNSCPVACPPGNAACAPCSAQNFSTYRTVQPSYAVTYSTPAAYYSAPTYVSYRSTPLFSQEVAGYSTATYAVEAPMRRGLFGRARGGKLFGGGSCCGG